MTKSVRSLGLLLLAGALAVSVSCAKKPVKAPDVQPTPAPLATPVPTVVEAPTEFPQTQPTPEDPTLKPDVDALNAKGYLKDSFFDFDKYDIREDQRAMLTSDAEWLRKYSTVRVRVEGHCDERGTSQYNLALGEKRANAAKEYLVSLGVDGTRIDTVSYGKERPFDTGHDESAWSKNRRAHFVIIAK
jgi:peptidoglycan-associated lipoprotein